LQKAAALLADAVVFDEDLDGIAEVAGSIHWRELQGKGEGILAV